MTAARMCVALLSLGTAMAYPLVASSRPAASNAGGAPASIFKTGYDKCRLGSLAAVSNAAGKTYSKARFDGKACTWSTADGNYVVLVDAHPTGYLELMVPSIGRHPSGEKVKAVTVPGAVKAVLDTHPFAATHRYQKDLFAAYPQGVIQVSLDYATNVPDSALIAVMRLVARA
jgi:hypothetical protein